MPNKLSAKEFAAFMKERAAKKDGYIMGARGENPKKWKIGRWPYSQYKGKQLKQAKKWREEAERVWDCQGCSEGYINEKTGSNIDIRARNNFANWCDPKGKGEIPVEYRKPGAAVFKGWPITHIGYLIEPVEPNNIAGDWYVGEAKGVMYGVVITRLNESKWTRWGLMTKYFYYEDYEIGVIPNEPEVNERELKRGMEGSDVKELQTMLIDLGYDLGRYGADGDFGKDTETAVKKFQKDNRLTTSGICDKETWEVLLDAFNPEEEEEEEEAPTEEPILNFEIDALDLSSYNTAKFNKIDWQMIKDKIGFLILRCGITRLSTKPLGVGIDSHFIRMAEKCNEYNIPFWAYYYSQGKTAEKAKEEAEFLFKTAEPYNPIGYVLDCEEKNIKVEAFFKRINELTDKKTMLYIGHNWYPVYKLPEDDDGYLTCCDAVWIPRYGKNDGTAKDKYIPKYSCDLWQYSSTFAFDGIPDKTLDVNRIIGQRRNMSWFRKEK